MILLQIKRLSDSSSVIPRDLFPSSVSDGDERTGVECIPDQFMNLFGIVSFIHDIKVRMTDPMALFQDFFSVWDIMNRMLGDLQTGNNLSISINRDQGFQESFSRFTGSPGIIVTGIRTGKPG
jgi:hypothetical protein